MIEIATGRFSTLPVTLELYGVVPTWYMRPAVSITCNYLRVGRSQRERRTWYGQFGGTQNWRQEQIRHTDGVERRPDDCE